MRTMLNFMLLFYFLILDITQAAPPVADGMSPPSVVCPRFPTRYEEDKLVVEIVKGECEMIISSVNMHAENADKVKSFRKRVKSVLRKVNVPTVSFRPLLTISALESTVDQNNTETQNNIPENQTESGPNTDGIPKDDASKPCTSTGYRFVGPVLVIDTMPGECQMMVVAHVGKNQKNLLRRLNKKGKAKKPRKNVMFEYIDEPFF